MSIMSTYEFDDSNILYKQFAVLANSYVDNPPEPSKLRVAQVPLENLYRLFEMFRFDAFADDEHCGVLDIDPVDYNPTHEVAWHTDIKTALENAFTQTFGEKPILEAISEMEDVLKHLSVRQQLIEDKKVNAKNFFSNFIRELAV